MRKPGLNAFTLKIIAIIAMAVDHVGYVFFPDLIWMRVIGRLTMPIMSFLIAEGYVHTRSVKKYALRLLIAAAVSAIPFSLAFHTYSLGVMWTLFLGLIALHAYRTARNPWVSAATMVGCIALSTFGDWPVFGVLMVMAFGIFREHFWQQATALAFILGAQYLSIAWPPHPSMLWAAAGVIALPLIYLYNGTRGRDARWLFYGFYPAHLAVIAAVSAWLISR